MHWATVLDYWHALRRRRRAAPNLLIEANDTARSGDWTAVRDVMQVRCRTGANQRRLFLQCLAAVVFIFVLLFGVYAIKAGFQFLQSL